MSLCECCAPRIVSHLYPFRWKLVWPAKPSKNIPHESLIMAWVSIGSECNSIGGLEVSLFHCPDDNGPSRPLCSSDPLCSHYVAPMLLFQRSHTSSVPLVMSAHSTIIRKHSALSHNKYSEHPASPSSLVTNPDSRSLQPIPALLS